MPTAEQKVTQYLEEAHASETGLVRTLQSQIAMTPDGRYRQGLERHLQETYDHAEKLERRIGELGEGANPLLAGLGAVESLSAQWMALAKAPFDLLRGSGGEEKVLKNAKDSAAAEALEIATYTAIERLAESVGDGPTARLAASIRKDEQRMLDLVLAEIPGLVDAVAKADLAGEPSYRLSDTGAGQAVREAGRETGRAATRTAKAASPKRSSTSRRINGRSARSTANKAANAPAKATGDKPATRRNSGTAAKPAAQRPTPTRRQAPAEKPATAPSLPVADYEKLTAEEIVGRLRPLTQSELAAVQTHERAAEARQTILERIDSLRESQPWSGYDEQTVADVRQRLSDADEGRLKAVREYERRHKDRAGVIEATERETVSG